MKYEPDKHHRRSMRLKGYDYNQTGAYFITNCTQDRECLFGEVVDGEMRLNETGMLVLSAWGDLPQRFTNVYLDKAVIMPNHVHGIIIVGAPLAAPVSDVPINKGAASSAPTLGNIMRAFKSISAGAVNRLLNRSVRPLWQRNYYEHIIRNEVSLTRIRQYILDNPAQWALDRENPDAIIKEAGNAWLV